MKADKLVEAIEAVGGRLALNGEKIRYAIPEDADADDLIKRLREHKPAVIEILRQRVSLPWPGYNDGQPFVCQEGGLHFDTSAGIAKHQVYGCGHEAPKAVDVTRTLPACPACGSFALYREKDGTMTCQTCGGGAA